MSGLHLKWSSELPLDITFLCPLMRALDSVVTKFAQRKPRLKRLRSPQSFLSLCRPAFAGTNDYRRLCWRETLKWSRIHPIYARRITLKPGAQPTPVVSTPQFNHFGAAVSADGRWLAYQSNESRRPEIYVRDFAETGGHWQISTGGGQEPQWSPDGRELYYRNNGSLMVVPIETRTGLQAGTPKNLFGEIYDLRSNSGETYDVDPRGGRFLLVRPPKEEVSSAQVKIVLNWFNELRRVVPAK